MIVVDACAWVTALVEVDERGDAVRDALGADTDWAMPGHGPIEVLGTLRKYVASGLITDEVGSRYARSVTRSRVRYVAPTAALFETLWLWRSRVALYDAPYAFLARELEAPLVTVDRRFAAAAGLLGIATIVPA